MEVYRLKLVPWLLTRYMDFVFIEYAISDLGWCTLKSLLLLLLLLLFGAVRMIALQFIIYSSWYATNLS